MGNKRPQLRLRVSFDHLGCPLAPSACVVSASRVPVRAVGTAPSREYSRVGGSWRLVPLRTLCKAPSPKAPDKDVGRRARASAVAGDGHDAGAAVSLFARDTRRQGGPAPTALGRSSVFGRVPGRVPGRRPLVRRKRRLCGRGRGRAWRADKGGERRCLRLEPAVERCDAHGVCRMGARSD
eukprot:scaffold5920_cov114-Isochrysis_galbana.AAC.7